MVCFDLVHVVVTFMNGTTIALLSYGAVLSICAICIEW